MMNRRYVLLSLGAPLGLSATGLVSRQLATPAQAHTATPFPAPAQRYCSLDLDAPDYIIALEIPADLEPDLLDQIEWIIDSRAEAAGVGACSIDRSGRIIWLNAQGLLTDVTALAALLAAPGQITLFDTDGDEVQEGDRVHLGQMEPGSQATPFPCPVYETVIGHGDLAGVSQFESTLTGEPVVSITLTADGAAKMLTFTSANVGEMLPVAIDGVVIATPIIQAAITDQIELQPLEPELIEQLVVFGAALSLPRRLSVASLEDRRSDS